MVLLKNEDLWRVKLGRLIPQRIKGRFLLTLEAEQSDERRILGEHSFTFQEHEPLGIWILWQSVITLYTSGVNIKKVCVLPTLYLCVLCGSENKQRLFPYTALTDCFL